MGGWQRHLHHNWSPGESRCAGCKRPDQSWKWGSTPSVVIAVMIALVGSAGHKRLQACAGLPEGTCCQLAAHIHPSIRACMCLPYEGHRRPCGTSRSKHLIRSSAPRYPEQAVYIGVLMKLMSSGLQQRAADSVRMTSRAPCASTCLMWKIPDTLCL